MKRLDKLSLIFTMVLPLQIASSMGAENSGASVNNLILTKVKGSELQLEARQMPLPQILDDIAKKTHIPIHYSVLPDGLISATCVGTNLKPILECLLAKKADLVFRNSQKPGQADEIEEAWIMGSSLASHSGENTTCSGVAENLSKEAKAAEKQENDADRINELLAMSNADNADDRVAAIGALMSEDHKEDPAVKAALEKAMADPNPSVRAQAVSTLAELEGDNNTSVLQDALHDESADVRLMAIGGVNANNVDLLQQAINDADENVRILAAARLEELKGSAEHP